MIRASARSVAACSAGHSAPSGALPRRPRPTTTDTAPAHLATMGTAPTDPNITDLATMELATTDTVDRNPDPPTRRSPPGVPRAERLMKRLPTTPPLSVARRDEGSRSLRLSSFRACHL